MCSCIARVFLVVGGGGGGGSTGALIFFTGGTSFPLSLLFPIKHDFCGGGGT